jgi:uncharacterized protein YaiL (DUF2058 family)
MSTSLRDQLLKVGLINQKQANDAERHQQHHERQRERESAPKRKPSRAPERGSSRGAVDARRPAHNTAPQRAPDARQGARPQAQAPTPAPAARLQADRLQAERKKAERKARFAEIKQLVEQNRLTASGDAVGEGEAYHFVDGAKIKRITVHAAARTKITSGEAVILRFDGRYELLPVEIAQRIRERDERIVIVKPPLAEPSASDAAYEAFPVPDDLIW